MPQGERAWLLARGWVNTFKTLREASKFPETLKFLIAYFFYSDSYSTLATVGILIFQDVLCMKSLVLGIVILEVMIIAIFGNIFALHIQVGVIVTLDSPVAFDLIVGNLCACIQVCTGGGGGISRVGKRHRSHSRHAIHDTEAISDTVPAHDTEPPMCINRPGKQTEQYQQTTQNH